MKMFIKNSYLFLIFFILFLSRDFFYGLIMPKEKININDLYSQKLESELEKISLIKDAFTKTSGVYGKVLYQNPYKFNEEIVIAVDTNDIEINNYVITNKGLLGIVDRVYQNRIIAKMITSKDILLQVRVNECYGLLKKDKIMYISGINNYCHVSPGDKVITSNLGYQDEEILIGTIGTLYIDVNRIDNKYEVLPEVNFDNLDYVVILTGDER